MPPTRGRAGHRGRRGNGSRYSVFLSHSSRDEWLAGVVQEKIRARRVRVWVDSLALHGGDDLMTAVLGGIRRASETVVLVSQDAIHSQWVTTEIGAAKAMSKRVTPLLNNVDPNALAPLKAVKSYELNAFEQFLDELAQRARRRGRS